MGLMYLNQSLVSFMERHDNEVEWVMLALKKI